MVNVSSAKNVKGLDQFKLSPRTPVLNEIIKEELDRISFFNSRPRTDISLEKPQVIVSKDDDEYLVIPNNFYPRKFLYFFDRNGEFSVKDSETMMFNNGFRRAIKQVFEIGVQEFGDLLEERFVNYKQDFLSEKSNSNIDLAKFYIDEFSFNKVVGVIRDKNYSRFYVAESISKKLKELEGEETKYVLMKDVFDISKKQSYPLMAVEFSRPFTKRQINSLFYDNMVVEGL